MKLNLYKTSAFAILLAGASVFGSCCSEGDDFNYNKKGIFITGTESDPMVKFVVEDTPSSYAITAQTTKKAESDISISFAIDASLVDAYNAKNGSSFFPIPEGSVVLENPEAIIKAGSALSSVANVKVVSTENFQDGRTYIIPVTIKSAQNTKGDQLIDASQTIYLKISRVLQFTSLVNDYRFSSNFIFDDSKAVMLTNFTYEIKVRGDGFGSRGGVIQRVCAFEEKDEKNASMLRFGENGYEGNQLQWVSPAGSIVSNTRFSANKWYMISLVYDGSEMIMYVDGVKDASLGASGKSVNFQRFELGMSWGGGYPSSQRFPGRLCEARVWNRALTPNEIVNGICGVDPASNGLIAYWKMNEGSGQIFVDATGNGYDMDWDNTSRDTNESGNMTPTHYGSLLNWVNDENNKCAQ